MFTVNLYSLIVLDPKRKLDYFRSAGWDAKWIATAREIVEAEFDRNYAHMFMDTDEDKDSIIVSSIFSFLNDDN
jgi:hypothetical protein